MATATIATAAGAATLLYYSLNRKIQRNPPPCDDEDITNNTRSHVSSGVDRVSRRLIQAPATWLETISTLSETLRFTYSETLGKWPLGDLAFGISFLLKRQGNLQVGNIYCCKKSIQLKGSEMIDELTYLLNLLTMCWHFSKKPFLQFLEETGFSEENVTLQEPKAGILKPAFTIIVDHQTYCILLLIRGTHSIKDTLTAVTGAVVPFHHTVVHEGGVSNLVLGYAHGGMVAAARWIAKLSTPCLIKALGQYPNYEVKILGHSLGGGTAALLTYILREQKELSRTSCVTFAPAACMTWELADSGNEFITSVINGADLVPTFSAASVDDLRVEVTSSAWLNDLRNQIERTRILSTVYRSASALGSRLPSIATAREKVAGAGAILQPVSNGTHVVMKRAQSMAQAAWTRPGLRLSSFSCIGHRRQATDPSDSKEDESSSNSSSDQPDTSVLIPSSFQKTVETIKYPESSFREEYSQEIEVGPGSVRDEHNDDREWPEDRMTETELWQKLEQELYNRREDGEIDEAREIMEEEPSIEDALGDTHKNRSIPEMKEAHRFFPAGKIMHIITFEPDNTESKSENGPTSLSEDGRIGIFLTSRSLYSKLRLSQSMISDHFMPAYRRRIERLITEGKKEAACGGHIS